MFGHLPSLWLQDQDGKTRHNHSLVNLNLNLDPVIAPPVPSSHHPPHPAISHSAIQPSIPTGSTSYTCDTVRIVNTTVSTGVQLPIDAAPYPPFPERSAHTSPLVCYHHYYYLDLHTTTLLAYDDDNRSRPCACSTHRLHSSSRHRYKHKPPNI